MSFAFFGAQHILDVCNFTKLIASQFLLHVTPDELRSLDGELTELLTRHRDRVADPARRPEGSRPVEMLVFAYRVED